MIETYRRRMTKKLKKHKFMQISYCMQIDIDITKSICDLMTNSTNMKYLKSKKQIAKTNLTIHYFFFSFRNFCDDFENSKLNL